MTRSTLSLNPISAVTGGFLGIGSKVMNTKSEFSDISKHGAARMTKEVKMRNPEEVIRSRKDILIRLLYTLLYFVVFEIIKLIVQVIVVFQYVFLFITLDYNRPVRVFSNKLVTYTYDVVGYLTLNKNQRPFPFNDFPEPLEESVEKVVFP